MVIKTIRPRQLDELRKSGRKVEIIDVRTPGEYARLHAEGAMLMPLATLTAEKVAQSRTLPADDPLYVICQSGARAAIACQKLHATGVKNIQGIEGGTAAWEKAGLPCVRGPSRVIPVERQVRVIAGILVLIGVALGWFVHPAFYVLSATVGAGLTVAGATDWCGMGMLLTKMPWNR
ncbi:rhodanese-like domain-containing protein [soil metagenome]